MSPANTPISAEIVTTGTEILLGEIVDTNAAWIAQQLRDAGVNLYFKTTVGDNTARVKSVLELGLSRSDVLIVTGGLGPTADDITRQAIAEATGRELLLNEEALSALQERFARFGVRMTDNNRQQALIPSGSILIPNPVGTAPGFIVETEQGAVIAIPGVPREMMRLMHDSVLPYLRRRSGYEGVIRRRVLRTIGIGESSIDDRLGDLMLRGNPTVGLAAKTAQADIRITARADSIDEAEVLIDQVAAEVYDRVGDFIYSETADEELEQVVVGLLASQGATLSIFETNEIAPLANRIRSAVGGPDVLLPSTTAENHGLPCAEAASMARAVDMLRSESVLACADGLRVSTGATYGLALIGTSDPDGGIFGRAAGHTWIALSAEHGEAGQELNYGGADDYTSVRLTNQALYLLWQTLRKP
jgi:nicotinamide-nucleotide amidase